MGRGRGGVGLGKIEEGCSREEGMIVCSTENRLEIGLRWWVKARVRVGVRVGVKVRVKVRFVFEPLMTMGVRTRLGLGSG